MRIDEFEFRNKQGEEIEPTKDQLVAYIKSLHKEIKTLKKALELTCNDMYWLCTFSGKFTKEEFISQKIDYFKTKAKEMIKSE